MTASLHVLVALRVHSRSVFWPTTYRKRTFPFTCTSAAVMLDSQLTGSSSTPAISYRAIIEKARLRSDSWCGGSGTIWLTSSARSTPCSLRIPSLISFVIPEALHEGSR